MHERKHVYATQTGQYTLPFKKALICQNHVEQSTSESRVFVCKQEKVNGKLDTTHVVYLALGSSHENYSLFTVYSESKKKNTS